MKARTVGVVVMGRLKILIWNGDGGIWEPRCLTDEVDHIHFESIDALIQPESRHVVNLLGHYRVLPIEIRLLLAE